MTKHEAKVIALKIITDELRRALDVSDEWIRNPDTDERLSSEEIVMVKHQAGRFLEQLETRISRS